MKNNNSVGFKVGGKAVLVLTLALALLLCMGAGMLAAEETVIDEDIHKPMGDIEIKEGTVVNGDVSVNMGSIDVYGIVNGNVKANMGSISVYGDVNGDLHADMGSVEIPGNVTGDVSAPMGSVNVDGNVGGNLKNSLGTTEVTGAVAGDINGGLGEMKIDGEVGGDVSSEGKIVAINGTVEGDVNLPKGIVELGPAAVVEGMIMIGEGMVDKSAGAQTGEIEISDQLSRAEIDDLFRGFWGIQFPGVSGVLNIFDEGHFIRDLDLEDLSSFVQIGIIGWFGNLLQGLLTMIILFALGVLIYVLFPRQVRNAEGEIKANTGIAFLWGLLAFIVAVPLMILLVITIIGIPLILVLILLLAAAWILGYVGITIMLGGWVLESAKTTSDNPMLNILVGVALLGFVSFVPVIGSLVSLAVAIMAVGASLSSRFGTNVNPPKMPSAK